MHIREDKQLESRPFILTWGSQKILKFCCKTRIWQGGGDFEGHRSSYTYYDKLISKLNIQNLEEADISQSISDYCTNEVKTQHSSLTIDNSNILHLLLTINCTHTQNYIMTILFKHTYLTLYRSQ